MALPPSRPDLSSPAAVAGASFSTARKGYDPDEVRELLTGVSTEMARLQRRVVELQRELDEVRSAPRETPLLDEETVTQMLGEETARIVSTAREASAQIRARAEESAAKMLREASEEAASLRSEIEIEVARRRSDATAAAEAEVEVARQQGRDMVNEARDYRERVLADVARRREMARQQLEQLVHGRDRLVNAFERARLAAVDVMSELGALGDEPDELVNLSPTTGPVALIPRTPVGAERDRDEVEARSGAAGPGGDMSRIYDVTQEIPVVGDTAASQGTPAQEPSGEESGTDGVAGADADAEPGGEPDEGPSLASDPGAEATAEPDADAGPSSAVEHSHARGGLHLAPALKDDETPDAADLPSADTETGAIDQGALAADTGGDVVRLPSPDEDDDYDEDDDEHDDRPSAPVVSLFAGEIDSPLRAETSAVITATPEADAATPSGTETTTDEQAGSDADDDGKPTVDDLFAKLRRASAAMVAKEAAEALADAQPTDAGGDTGAGAEAGDSEAGEGPAEEAETIFTARDEVLVPIILSSARKLKRVLADEQNDVLDALRRTSKVDRLDALLPAEHAQSKRYLEAIGEDLRSAARAGAQSLAGGKSVTAAVKPASVLAPVHDAFTADIVRPLRERLDRAVMQVGEDSAELATLVRNVYREWKTQRIDEHIEDLVRLAYGRGAYVVLAPGTGVCWRVDPNGPPCADAEDNSLGGVVPAGDPFPTGHTHPPVHSGCRCLLETTPG